MARKDPPEEPLLFDLPLAKGEASALEPEEGSARASGRGRERRTGTDHLRPLEARRVERSATRELPDPEDVSETRAGGFAASRSSRFLAGLADLIAHAAVAVLGLIGARQLGLHPRLSDWPGFAVFLLSFSFLYVVVSLAFWGHTLGMVWAGITARSRDGDALSFDQAVRRWLGGFVSAGLAGIPVLLAFRGRAPSDLFSASETVRQQ